MPINRVRIFGPFARIGFDPPARRAGEPVFPTRMKDRLARTTVYVAVELPDCFTRSNWKAR